MSRSGYHCFPFAALLGQEELCRALLANAVDPRCGGVLVRGEKGTAKSTASRALADLLPDIEVRAGCACNCGPGDRPCPDCLENPCAPAARRPAPFVDLPLNATEDRVAGSLDFEHAVRHGQVRFTPGLLARAHRGVLYVDEVNLLDHHLAALILDAAASGEHVVEREGVSLRHAARFILVGTMNPEEGPLGPQITDRFGLCVDVSGMADPALRVGLLRLTLAREADPAAFVRQWASRQEGLRSRLETARSALPELDFPAELLARLAGWAREARVQGQRAELAMRRTAAALAALDGKTVVDADAVDEAALLALRHRKRDVPPPPPTPPQPEAAPQDDSPPPMEQDQSAQPPDPPPMEQSPPEGREGDSQGRSSGVPPQERVFSPGDTFEVARIETRKDRLERTGRGKRSRSRTAMRSGRYVRSGPDLGRGDLALDATLRAAAPHQARRRHERDGDGPAVLLQPSDVREKVRERRMGALMLLAVDASGSMGAQKRMEEAKGAVLSLLQDAYRKRDRVGFIAFRKDRAELLLPPTSSPDLAMKMLDELPTGGRTPLAHGLALAYETAERELRRNPSTIPLLVFVTDGRANVSLDGEGSCSPLQEVEHLADGLARDGRMHCLVVDMEPEGFVRLGLAGSLAQRLGAVHHRMDTLRREGLGRLVADHAQALLPDE